MFCIVAYDMPDNRRRTKLFKTMKGFGMHTQFSLFECELQEPAFRRMLVAIEKIVVPKEDNIKVYTLCRNCLKVVRLMGVASLTTRPDYLIF